MVADDKAIVKELARLLDGKTFDSPSEIGIIYEGKKKYCAEVAEANTTDEQISQYAAKLTMDYYLALKKRNERNKMCKVVVLGNSQLDNRNMQRYNEAVELLAKDPEEAMKKFHYMPDGKPAIKLVKGNKAGSLMVMPTSSKMFVFGVIIDSAGNKPVMLQANGKIAERFDELKPQPMSMMDTMISNFTDSSDSTDSSNSAGIASGTLADFKISDAKFESGTILDLIKCIPNGYKLKVSEIPAAIEASADKPYSNTKGFAVIKARVADITTTQYNDVNTGYSLYVSDASLDLNNTFYINAKLPLSTKVDERFGNGTIVYIFGTFYKSKNLNEPVITGWSIFESLNKSEVMPPPPKIKEEIMNDEADKKISDADGSNVVSDAFN
jgi:hypothetical protein